MIARITFNMLCTLPHFNLVPLYNKQVSPINIPMRYVKRIIQIIAGVVLLLILLLIAVILVNSPGKPTPFLDNNGKKVSSSIAATETVNINGLNQRIIIRGRDTTKPVLLYLHGGPGDPEFPFVHYFNPGIENIFVVCYWDQRGAGLSYSKNIPPETMTLSQFVDDAGKVSEYLINKFHSE